MAATPAWLAAIEALVNRGIRASTQATGVAQRLDETAVLVAVDRLITIRASVLGTRLSLLTETSAESGEAHAVVHAEVNAEVNAEANAEANATLSGSAMALFAMLTGGDETASWQARAQISGDAEVADLYRQLFLLAQPDFEEELSHLVGDMPARRAAVVARKALSWMRAARRTAGMNIAEYLQEESRDLVNRTELEEFLQGVDALREAADRVDARLKWLEHRLRDAS